MRLWVFFQRRYASSDADSAQARWFADQETERLPTIKLVYDVDTVIMQAINPVYYLNTVVMPAVVMPRKIHNSNLR